MSLASAIALCCALSASAVESSAETKARLELEKQLNEIVTIPAPVAHVLFTGFDEDPYQLAHVEFRIDGKLLPERRLESLKALGAVTIFRGEVSQGDHVLTATVAYTDESSFLYSSTAGYTWRVTSKINFTAQRALETRILLTPARDASKRREAQFTLSSQVTPVPLEVVERPLVVAEKATPVVVEPTPTEEPLSPPPLVAADVELPQKAKSKRSSRRVK